MPKSYRHVRAAKAAAAGQRPDRTEYEILDPAFRPDMRGEFAGAKVRLVAGSQRVLLTDAQAKFYLDSGAIRPLTN